MRFLYRFLYLSGEELIPVTFVLFSSVIVMDASIFLGVLRTR